MPACGRHCAWTSGTWDFGADQARRWNGIQNTPNDVRLLTSHLLRAAALTSSRAPDCAQSAPQLSEVFTNLCGVRSKRGQA